MLRIEDPAWQDFEAGKKAVFAMANRRNTGKRGGLTAALLCAGAIGLAAAPSAVLALGGAGGMEASSSGSFATFTPAAVNQHLSKLVAATGINSNELMRFTPASSASQPGRSVTVAVRVDESAAQLISLNSGLASAKEKSAASSLRIAPTRYNLGLSRGYQGFAQARPTGLATDLDDAAIPDLASFQPSEGAKDKPSRFNARIALEEEENAGRAPRTLEGLSDQTFDLGGSYSVTRNLDVTAGVRYSQDRNQVAPLTNGKQDSQAVYVGTQFRF